MLLTCTYSTLKDFTRNLTLEMDGGDANLRSA